MSDDKSKTGGADRLRISLAEDYEIKGWARKFGVTPQELAAAVQAVGHDAHDVEAWLLQTKPH